MPRQTPYCVPLLNPKGSAVTPKTPEKAAPQIRHVRPYERSEYRVDCVLLRQRSDQITDRLVHGPVLGCGRHNPGGVEGQSTLIVSVPM